ncbi:hypothetical protein SPRG_20566 [Saprolegnia parasitica CBS 223.65]|uniref:CSC1/OSCA1-like cytosolic domain-containing protein n=1 Tax=Saprolegnia parasitica (strain CBS 223.65) TaxID=695850 RepID=A0A067CJQ7_SAPPC|nr:hypothetical protein SPRG_20566 [Saprolegnia parasitica CBS 223.65]KDO26761.1 hypothetical protein SPRG_20566 [Saprolegnia parasitica CBS 223.65]|eukprot:XP_012202518.1 hypothetical protein SPRG_20566 [Saprolegnia parasitica CBS 223.65]
MSKVAPLKTAEAREPCDTGPSRSAMAQTAKALALAERLGAGKAFRKTTLRDIGELGIGVQLYFMLIKYGAIVLGILSVFAVPSAVLHYYGHGILAANADPLKLTYLSIANEGVNPGIDASLCQASGGHVDCSGSTIDTPLTSDPKVASYIIAGCDCAYSIVFWIFIGLFGHLSRRAVRLDAVQNSTPAKYAVRVKGLPRDATDAELLEHFNARYALTLPEMHYPLWLGCFGRRRPPRRPTTVPATAGVVANVEHVDGDATYLGKWVAQVAIARPTGGLLRHFLSLEHLTTQLAALEDILSAYRKLPTRYAKKLALAEATQTRLQARMERIVGKMTSLKTTGLRRLAECECAYIVFENTESRRRCLRDYRTSSSSWKRLWQPKDLRFRGQFAIIVEPAPEPSNIIWENLETSATSRFLRRSLTNILTFLLLLLSCGVISLANSSQRKFNVPVLTNLCEKIQHVYEGPSSTPTDSSRVGTLVWNDSILCGSDASFAITFANVSAPPPLLPPFLNYNDVRPPQNLSRCISPCFNVSVDAAATCGTLPCFTTDRMRTSNNASSQCEAYAPDSILNCYCMPLLEAAIQKDGVLHGPRQLWTNELPCQSYITAYLTKTSLLIAAALTVILVNVGLQGIFYAFASFERHSSESRKAAAVVLKLFFAQWINTAVIVLIVNASLGNVPLVSSLLSGQYMDFERDWYTSVGAGLTMTMLINAVAPQIGPVLNLYVTYPLSRCFRGRYAVTQAQMNALYANPSFNIALRYPVVLNTLFVTLMYAGGLPVLLPVGALALFLTYLLDKLTIMKLCSVRTAFDEALGSLAMQLLPWVLFLHLGFSAWMFGNSSILASDLLSVNVVVNALASSINGGNSTALLSDDPTALVQMALETQMTSASPVVRTLYRYLLKAFLKIIRLDTFPVFFLLVLVTLWMLLSSTLWPLLTPLLRILRSCIRRSLKRLCVRATVHPTVTALADDASPFPPFSALFERHVGLSYACDVAKGFVVDENGVLTRRWPQNAARMRTWEAFAAPVKTYDMAKNPKYTMAVQSLASAQAKVTNDAILSAGRPGE